MKPKLIVWISLIFVILIAVGCQHSEATGQWKLSENEEMVIEQYLTKEVLQPNFGGEMFTTYEILGTDLNASEVYLWALIEEYYQEGGNLEQGTGMSVPMVLHAEKNTQSFKILKHTLPGDGSNYIDDIKTMFPSKLHNKIVDYDVNHISKLIDEMEDKVQD
ncbi:hypothetical protein [Alkalihalobacterium chitinilyticum]|uniref:DUF4825 domain-containing protein n=1 Tax=Alkalihalobacterium chitinilyticum TaxID=2980103 RepID=A0ABT5VL32_9BACI|nr:hypothetical protein [Alkalihalobacterium chitinilyticum]MDE5416124.1 hypothetical protein [Alkalihalobacterium chitinilyticum]